MANQVSNKQRFAAQSRKIALAAGLVCSVPSLAIPLSELPVNPTQLLPQTFTRIEYVNVENTPSSAAVSTLSKAPESLGQIGFFRPLAESNPQVIASSPAPVKRSPEPNTEYAKQDLDLALENFFYALEDLIQSAARYEEADPLAGSNVYAAQVQFPAQVMASYGTTDRASNAVVGAAENSTLPAAATTTNASTGTGLAFLDSFNYTTKLSAQIEHNDNIYTTRNSPIEDQILRTNVNSVAESRSRKSALKFEGDLNTGNYYANPSNNYVDWSLTGSYSALISQRSKAFGGLGYFYHHEDAGEGSTDGDLDFSIGEPVEFESWVARGIYERGTKQTRARLVADTKLDLLRTTNFQDIPAIKARDRDIASITGTAFYNWSQRSSYLFELRHQDISYVNALEGNNLDSTQTRYAIGTEWLATRQTAGSIRVGIQDKNYNNQPSADTRNISWEAIVEWAPKPRTQMVFETVQDIEESDGFGTARDRTDFKITWKQKWTPRMDSQTSVQYGITGFEQETREDELSLFNAELNYSLTSSTLASLKLTYIDNSSNVAEFGFDRSQIQFGLNMDL